MEPGRETIRSVAFAVGYIAFGLSIGLFLVDLAWMHFAMAFHMLAPAILQAFSLYLFHESFAVRHTGKGSAAVGTAHLPRL